MQPESLIQLAGSGNIATVEDEWMKVLESSDLTPGGIARYAGVLETLAERGRAEEAGALAWVALEALGTRFNPAEAIGGVGPILLAVPKNAELRKQATQLYESAYADREGLAELFEHAGLEGGRPVRRALRTLDVCLSIQPGVYAARRYDEGAVRVEQIDTSDWSIRFVDGSGSHTLDPVRFADAFVPAEPDDFRVMRQFDQDGLTRRLEKDPAGIVVALCKLHGNKLDSDELESILVPEVLKASDWKKWWTKARTALRRVPQIIIEGRSPYYLTYDGSRDSVEARHLARFELLRDPMDRWTLVEKYVRECKQHNRAPDADLLRRFHGRFEADAKRRIKAGAKIAMRDAVLAARSGALIGIDDPFGLAVELVQSSHDINGLIALIDDDALMCTALDCVKTSRPDSWRDIFAELLPRMPFAVCDHLAQRLVDAGLGVDQFDPIVQRILASPLDHNEALLWLWNGPTRKAEIANVRLLTILMRILGVLGDLRRDDSIDRKVARERSLRARAVLSSRKYERFETCLEGIEKGMALTVRTQIRRLDSLGRVVCEDLLRRISDRFPDLHAKPEVSPWLREDVLFVTPAGMARRQAEIEEHVNVKIKENARAIGEAASKGDLSENAEFKSALEERDLLRGRLAIMQNEMSIARVLDPGDVPSDHVGIGSKVTLKQADNQERIELSIVDPWSADIDRNSYNYRSPLAQSILGKRTGDTLELQLGDMRGSFEIEAIGSAVAERG